MSRGWLLTAVARRPYRARPIVRLSALSVLRAVRRFVLTR
jgi:hypothetical protein